MPQIKLDLPNVENVGDKSFYTQNISVASACKFYICTVKDLRFFSSHSLDMSFQENIFHVKHFPYENIFHVSDQFCSLNYYGTSRPEGNN